jgi:hypothetical protein
MARAVGDKNLSSREQQLKAKLLADREAYKAKLNAKEAQLQSAKLRIKELSGRLA